MVCTSCSLVSHIVFSSVARGGGYTVRPVTTCLRMVCTSCSLVSHTVFSSVAGGGGDIQ
jgi:hypothetical protein